LLVSLFFAQANLQIPKNNPNGIWESTSGTHYQLRLDGAQLSVKLVPGSSPKYVSYEVELTNSKDEINTYLGKGFFVAKMGDNKECRYETKWRLTVVTPDRIVGATSNIIPEPEGCGVKERKDPEDPRAAGLDLRKK